uniref:Uncharacterized protein n=1 Tax=Zea mays TaxID=4577 RepID=A0A804LR67_MAIZE
MGRRKEHLERVRVEAYCWDVFKPVEMVEIDSMEKLDDAFRMANISEEGKHSEMKLKQSKRETHRGHSLSKGKVAGT